MKSTTSRVALVTSLLLNVGVAIAVGMTMFRSPTDSTGRTPLHDYLALDAAQTQRWHELEQPFLRKFGETSAQIEAHRTALISAIFVRDADRAALEAERAAIAELQAEQQRLLLDQLLAEREVLTQPQRVRLAKLLLDEGAAPSPVERMHAR